MLQATEGYIRTIAWLKIAHYKNNSTNSQVVDKQKLVYS